MHKKTAMAHLALLGANVLYSASFTIAKEVMPHYIQSSAFVLIRAVGAAFTFWSLSFIFKNESVDKKDFKRLFTLSVFGVATNQLFFLKGLSLTTPINAAILMITTPIIVLVMGSIFMKEKISLTTIFGIIIGFSGAVLLLTAKGAISFQSAGFVGDLCILVNAVSWGGYLILVKPLMKKYHTITILKWVFLFGSMLVFPFGFNQLQLILIEQFTPTIWLDVLFIVIGVTVVAYLFNTYALKELSSSVVSAYIYLQPLLAAAIALYAGKDAITSIKIISSILIFTGVFLASKNNTHTTPKTT